MFSSLYSCFNNAILFSIECCCTCTAKLNSTFCCEADVSHLVGESNAPYSVLYTGVCVCHSHAYVQALSHLDQVMCPPPPQCYRKELRNHSFTVMIAICSGVQKTQLFGSNLEWNVLKTKKTMIVTLIVYMLSMKQRGWKERYIRIQMWILRFIKFFVILMHW